jgi:hypothetical protein
MCATVLTAQCITAYFLLISETSYLPRHLADYMVRYVNITIKRTNTNCFCLDGRRWSIDCSFVARKCYTNTGTTISASSRGNNISAVDRLCLVSTKCIEMHTATVWVTISYNPRADSHTSFRSHILGDNLANSRATRWHSGWGTALQTGRSRVRFPMMSLDFFIDITLPVALWPWGRLSL